MKFDSIQEFRKSLQTAIDNGAIEDDDHTAEGLVDAFATTLGIESKSIEVMDEDGNPIEDVAGTLIINRLGKQDADDDDESKNEEDDEETKPGEEDEEEDIKAHIEATIKSALKEALKRDKINVQAKARKPVPDTQSRKVPANVKRYKLQRFKGVKNGDEPELRAYRFGMWALARLNDDISKFHFPNAVKYCNDMGLKAVHATNDNALGAYLVPEEFGQDLIDLREEFGVARRLLKNRPMSSDTRTDPRRAGGLTAHFVAEGAAGTESNKNWDQVRLTAKDLMVLSRYTSQLNEDAVINIGDDLAGEISYAFSNKEDECAFNGDGTSTFGGIQGFLSKLVGKAGLVDQASGNTWAAITLADFEKTVGKLPQYADTANAVWVTHRTFYYEIMVKLLLAQGGSTAQEASEGQRKPRPLFLGYPVEFSQVFPSATGTDTVSATLGDHSLAASFGDRGQESIAFSEHATIGGENVFERNEIAIRGVERFDINVHDVGTASDVGPVVGISTGS